jgi:hypothetical protein
MADETSSLNGFCEIVELGKGALKGPKELDGRWRG